MFVVVLVVLEKEIGEEKARTPLPGGGPGGGGGGRRSRRKKRRRRNRERRQRQEEEKVGPCRNRKCDRSAIEIEIIIKKQRYVAEKRERQGE